MTGHLRAARRVGFWLLAGAVVLSGLAMIYTVIEKPGPGALYDFHGGLYNAGLAILHGHSPYRPGFLAHQAAVMRSGRIAIGETAARPFSIPVYPAAANLAMLPLSLLPFWLAGTIYTVASIVAMLVGLRLLGVRDWRCLVLATISWPFMFGLYLGAVGPLLVLGVGVVWRHRDRLWPPALAAASLIAAKVFPWPVAVWLLLTRRYRAFALTIAAGGVLTLGAWAVIGFDGMLQYPRMLSEISFIQEGRAVSVASVLDVAGVPSGIAGAAALVLAAGLLLVAWRIASGPDGARRAFALAVVAALASTPIVWEHYMVLLLVPIALVSPRASKLWLLPMCTPLISVVSAAIVPVGSQLGPHPPETLRLAVPWMAIQGVIALRIVFPTARLRMPRRSRLRSAPSRIKGAATAAAAGSAELA